MKGILHGNWHGDDEDEMYLVTRMYSVYVTMTEYPFEVWVTSHKKAHKQDVHSGDNCWPDDLWQLGLESFGKRVKLLHLALLEYFVQLIDITHRT